MNLSLFIIFCVFSSIKSNEEKKYIVPQLENLLRSGQKRDGAPDMLLIPQKLDNFNDENKEIWEMRVQHNGQFFEPDGPIFIMIGGENPFSDPWLQQGQMFDMAKENNAYMFYTEHRFYGQSVPNRSLSLENLRYLTPDQALADIINLVRFFKFYRAFSSSKVVVFGGSYAGNLALWLRSKYPDDIHAAVSSSAPLLAKFDFQEYNEVVQENLGPDCSQTIFRAIEQILQLLGTPEGASKIKTDFNMCHPVDLTDPLEISYLLSIITTHFGGVIQNYGPQVHKKACRELLTSYSTNEYSRLVDYLNTVLGPGCKRGYSDFKNYVKTTNSGNLRQWMYQSCTQFGFFQTTESFLPVEIYQQRCTDFFGSDFNPTKSRIGLSRTNLIFGGLNPDVTRVVSIQGTGDPWHKLGLTKDLSPEAPVIIVNGTYHCQDLKSISDLDSPEMKEAKLKVQGYVKKWLQEE